MPGPGLELFGKEEVKELIDVLSEREMSRYRFDDDGSALPSKVFQFERELEAYTRARHCLGMNSCTSALLAGMWAAGIGSGDEVIVPGYTFIASMAAVAYAGAIPVLAEIDESLTLDPDDVETKITPQTKAIMAVHMLGAPCDMARLKEIADRRKLLIFEDCAQAGGGEFKGRALGTFGAFGAFSLNVFKTFTAGDGGVLLTNDTGLYERAFAIHDHGARPNRVGVSDADSFLGLNFRMHEMTGAVAVAQVRKLRFILSTLRENKKKLKAGIGNPDKVRERLVHDTEGECATVLTYIFDTAKMAERVATALGTKTLIQSGKHYYANMPLLARRALPFRSPGFNADPVFSPALYEKGSLPRTDDLLARSLSLSVGVVDSYLGTGFGINILSNETDISEAANRFFSEVRRASKLD